MKHRIRKTGEIIDLIAYSGDTNRSKSDCVKYIASDGSEVRADGMNYYWDLEELEESNVQTIDWEQRRYEIAKDIYSAMLGRSANYKDEQGLLEDAILFTDALIAKLKKEEGNE